MTDNGGLPDSHIYIECPNLEPLLNERHRSVNTSVKSLLTSLK